MNEVGIDVYSWFVALDCVLKSEGNMESNLYWTSKVEVVLLYV